MRYQFEPKSRKYVKRYGFLSFAKKFGDEYGEKIIDNREFWIKDNRATGDLIGNKIADEITSVGKSKSKEKEDKTVEIYILLEKRQQIIDNLILF